MHAIIVDENVWMKLLDYEKQNSSTDQYPVLKILLILNKFRIKLIIFSTHKSSMNIHRLQIKQIVQNQQ